MTVSIHYNHFFEEYEVRTTEFSTYFETMEEALEEAHNLTTKVIINI